jgi:hypothetical protein
LSLDGRKVDALISGVHELSDAAPVSSDRKWILYSEPIPSNPSVFYRLMRFPLAGGASVEVFRSSTPDIACAQVATAPCVLAELSSDRKQIVFTALDPVKGRGLELARFDDAHTQEWGWDLSPSGKQVVLYSEVAKRFIILSLEAQSHQRTDVRTKLNLRTMRWASDGAGFFAGNATQSGAELLYVNLKGTAQTLWTVRGRRPFVMAEPSPDGHHLAIQAGIQDSNLWMIENF